MRTQRDAPWLGMTRLQSADDDVVRRAKAGDEDAYRELVERYAPGLYRLAFSLVGNAADAEDVLQETFVGAFRHLPRFEQRASVRTWLSRILVRQAARHHRTRARLRAVRREGPAGSIGRSDVERLEDRPVEETETRIDLLGALDALEPIHREVLSLREFQGLSYQEMAEVLGVPRGTVESRLYRARQALKEKLKDYLAT